MYRPRTTNEWIFVGTATAQAACTTGLDLFVVLSYFNWIYPVSYQVPRSYVVPVNFGLFILGNIWQAILAIDALRMKNILQLYSIVVLDFCLFVFSVMRYFQTQKAAASLMLGETMYYEPFAHRDVDYWGRVRPALLTSSIAVGASAVVSTILVFLLQRELRWAIYRHISGSLAMLRRYLAYQVLLVLIRIEPYFLISFVITYGLVNVHFVQPEFGLTMALIPALAIQVALTIYFTRTENYIGAIIAILLRMGEMAYLLSRILTLKGDGFYSRTILKDEMLLFASVALGLATLACINAMLCTFNFNKGLKPLLHRSSWKQTPHEFEPVHQHRYAERIELD
ncbi:hypothetical protein HBH98_013200 [Parastagonospora nodorum]|nr:hypothetical protein HBH98_013200 [Parastagonospora nodorum]KAH4397326.1 hypothetical protein HBH97_001730 [Parastagonospora nodorum]KAH4429691.1 hypothetical protein HBH99_013260 [Parastagonospora nodorum]KAH5336227.1 hypothetical protein HBI12_030360 [Parastagonospora nodorum]KAH5454020.1 hypothetical protein HBI47_013120 [Parastagonospora nodorum]